MTWRRSFFWALVALVVLAGCDMRDMYDQPKVKPLQPSDFFADGRGSRMPPEGTVAHGLPMFDDELVTGKVAGKEATHFPFRITEADMARGRERFNIYCTPCHDRMGTGHGMIVRRGYTQPPSFHEERLRSAPPGHFVNVMTAGFGSMPSYALQVDPQDRWRITAYIRALQYSRQGKVEMVPQDKRSQLDGGK
jgi:hypothetical protein